MPLQVHNIHLHIYHGQTFGARVDIMEPWLHGLQVSTKLLIHSLVALRHDPIWIVDETATNAWHPCSHAATALAPADHALAVAWNLIHGVVHFGQLNMLRFAV